MDLERNLRIGKLFFNMGTKKEAAELIDNFSVAERSVYVIFWGVPMVVASYDYEEFQEIERKSLLCLADGKPIVSFARRCGFEKIERCGGPDVMDIILKEGLNTNRRHFFYGSTDSILKEMREKLEQLYPGINIVGMYSPPFRPVTEEEDAADTKMINDAHPDYVWVALGEPKQERWAMSHCESLKGTRIMAVGAAINFYAGTTKRAPKWIQGIGLEWAYRLCQEPGRLWRRYLLSAPKFLKVALFDKEKIL